MDPQLLSSLFCLSFKDGFVTRELKSHTDFKEVIYGIDHAYVDYLNRVEDILSEKTTWKEFSKKKREL